MKLIFTIIPAVFIICSCNSYKPVGNAVQDKMMEPELKNTVIEGHVGKKMETFFEGRIFSDYAKSTIMQEAEDAFKNKIDDVVKAPIGYWQGEFWGKLMISASRVARYHDNPEEIKYISELAHRLLQYQEEDGYLGSYSDKEFLTCPDPVGAKAAMGWDCDWCWNLWCRKYTMWGLLQAYETTGEKELLDAVVKSMDQEIEMLDRLGLKVWETGTPHFNGLPSCSVLKPLLQLYKYTGFKRYLSFADEIVKNWDCDDRHIPALITNAFTDVPVSEWYPNPNSWAKAYEMMSCLDGLLEYYRVCGSERCLDAVIRIHSNIWQTERNQMDNVGFNDQFAGGGKALNGISEPCDAIHWMRLNHDLFLITGNPAYIDIIESTFFNAFLAGVMRDGKWGARGVRSEGRHYITKGQAMMEHNHCCVDNIPRAFMDLAQTLISKDRTGTIHINWYSDCEASIGDCKVKITGNYPVSNKVKVDVKTPKTRSLKFRIPGWCSDVTVNGTKLKLAGCGGCGGCTSKAGYSHNCQVDERCGVECEGQCKQGGWFEAMAYGDSSFEIEFDMNPRIVCSDRPSVSEYDKSDVHMRRWVEADTYLSNYIRKETCARIYYGPLILAKSVLVGDSFEEIYSKESINDDVRQQFAMQKRFAALGLQAGGDNWQCSLTPMESDKVWGAWEMTMTKGNEKMKLNVCDYSSAGDFISDDGQFLFSIFF